MATEQTVGIGSASATHDRMVAANAAQQRRYVGVREDEWSTLAPAFRADPRRRFDTLLERIASYVQPSDVVVDVGGGAGRLSLPLALHCKEVIVVDPSRGMGNVFDATVEESGIKNARFVCGGWPATGIDGDVALVAHVTYFVREIVPFVQCLNTAARRRVMACVRSVPPPNQIAPFFELVHGEKHAPVPGHNETIAVLNELGIKAELIDNGPATASATSIAQKTREDAIKGEVDAAQKMGWLGDVSPERFAQLVGEHFDELLVETDKGFIRRNVVDARDLLITWETR